MTRARTRRRHASPDAAAGASPRPASPRRSAAAILGLFAVGFLTLGVIAYRQTSATWDEPIHLTAGYAAATSLDFRVEPAHPPFLRMWSALPTLLLPAAAVDVAAIDTRAPDAWLQDAYLVAHKFLYVDNDADRLLYRARFMVLLLGVGLGGVLFFWARAWLGIGPAIVALALLALEPNLLSHASLVTTDFGVTVFICGAVYFGWRLRDGAPWWATAGLAGCTALAIVSKFTALLLVPLIATLLAAAVVSGRVSRQRAMTAFGAMVGVTYITIWAAYGFRYLPSTNEAWHFALQGSPIVHGDSAIAAVAAWLDAHRLLPNAFTQGVLYAHASVAALPGFLAGETSDAGWWYYFPVAIGLKTPLTILLLMTFGLAVCARQWRQLGGLDLLFVLAPAGTFLGAAILSNVNIGIRHVLPIYPFIVMVAAIGARDALRWKAGGTVLAVAVLLLVVEVGTVYPHTLTFFNLAAGGPGGGHRLLVDSNIDWGQGLKALKTWMTRHDVAHVNLAYFGQADPAYYGIQATHLPGAPGFALDAIARPRLPGYVAISTTTLSGVYSGPEWRLFYQPFRDRAPAAIAGNTIRIYWVDEWPAADESQASGDHRAASARLGDALLFGLQWPEQAIRRYERHLERYPGDTDVRVNHGIALVATHQEQEAVAEFRRAVAAEPRHGRARLTLARALLGSGDLQQAAQHAEQAVRIAPADADAHYLRGRVHAAQGQFLAAHHEFERATQLEPEHQDAQRDLARVRHTIALTNEDRREPVRSQ